MIKVYKVSELIKFLIKIVFPAILILVIINAFPNKQSIAKVDKNNFNYITCLDDEIEQISYKKEKNKFSVSDIISSTFLITKNLKEDDGKGNEVIIKMANNSNEDEKNSNDSQFNEENSNSNQNQLEDNNAEEKVEQAKTDVKIEKVQNSVNPRVTNEYKNVKINNSSKKELTEDMLNPDGISVNTKKVIIYHTHTSESYTPTEKNIYSQTGNFRTTDLNYNVTRVGDELQKQLESYGIKVVHNKTFHDYPAYNGSYSRSLRTAEQLLKDNSDADIVIDLHRDAISDSTYAPKVKINDEYCSQLMFVIGTDVSKSINSNWNQNLKFAIKLQEKANELYPGLFKPIILRNGEYNQHIAKASCIIEVGSTGNTLEESIASMKYLAKVISELK